MKMRTDWNPLGVPHGFCRCGCGERTPIASRNRRDRGIVKGQPMPFIQHHQGRLNFKIDPETGCWPWQGGCDKNGYGFVRWHYKMVRAHRAIFEQVNGPIPEGMVLDHLCRNPRCVNPLHLEPVTNAENIQRGNSSPLDPADIAAIRASDEKLGALAARYGVDESTISRIRSGKRWSTGKQSPAGAKDCESRRWKIWKWDDERFGLTGPRTDDLIPDGQTGVEAARASEVEVLRVSEHEAIVARLESEVSTEEQGAEMVADSAREEIDGWRERALAAEAKLVTGKQPPADPQEIDQPHEHGVTPLDEAVVEDMRVAEPQGDVVEAAAEALWNAREFREPTGDEPKGWCPPGHDVHQEPPSEPFLWEQMVAERKYPGSQGETRSDARAVVAAITPLLRRVTEEDRQRAIEALPVGLWRSHFMPVAEELYRDQLVDLVLGAALNKEDSDA